MQENTVTAKLIEVPLIGNLLVMERLITTEQNEQINNALKSGKYPGKFYLQIMEEEKIHVEQTLKDACLLKQASLKISASLEDMKNIIKGEKLDFKFLKPFWGKDDIPNAKIDNANKTDSASVAANIAQLLVLLSNGDKELGFKALNGIKAAEQIVYEITNGNKNAISFGLQAKDILETLKTSLQYVAKNKINDDTLNQYIENRFADIENGLDIGNKFTKNILETTSSNEHKR
ncbi:MAG: hypothetical protein ACK4OM_03570 [Alphaproteobacteria bacterium]